MRASTNRRWNPLATMVIIGCASALFVACGQATNGTDDGADALGAGSGASGAGGRDGGLAVPPAEGCEREAVDPTRADDCDAPIVPGTDRTCTFEVGGRRRQLLIYAPATYNPCRPSALVVDAHGASESAPAHAGKVPFRDWPGGLGSGWRLVADREGFIVAQPQGVGNVWNELDADFMLEIPAFVSRGAALDPNRVYLTGISNGGQLSYWTACRDTNTFRAFAPISGFGPRTCPIDHHAPLIHFHSPDDAVIPFASGEAVFQTWLASNHCQGGPRLSWKFGGPNTDTRPVCLQSSGSGASTKWTLEACSAAAPETTCETWDRCDDGVAATLCAVSPDLENHYDTTGGHILYVNGTSLSLAAVTWEFFKQFD